MTWFAYNEQKSDGEISIVLVLHLSYVKHEVKIERRTECQGSHMVSDVRASMRARTKGRDESKPRRRWRVAVGGEALVPIWAFTPAVCSTIISTNLAGKE